MRTQRFYQRGIPPARVLTEDGAPRAVGASPAGPPPERLRWGGVLQIGLVCAAIVCAAVASSVAVAGSGTVVRGARVDILYISEPGTPLDVRERTLATQRELIMSRAVLGPAAARAGMALGDLQQATSVTAGARNDLLHITVGDPSAPRAQALTEAVTSAYFALSRRLASGVRQERRTLEREMQRLTLRATRASTPEATIIGHRVARLQDRSLQLDAAGVTGARPTRLAGVYRLAEPLAPRPLRAVAAGLIIGLALATGVAILLARRWPAR